MSSVVGRIVDEAGLPVANVEVLLLRGATNGPFALSPLEHSGLGGDVKCLDEEKI